MHMVAAWQGDRSACRAIYSVHVDDVVQLLLNAGRQYWASCVMQEAWLGVHLHTTVRWLGSCVGGCSSSLDYVLTVWHIHQGLGLAYLVTTLVWPVKVRLLTVEMLAPCNEIIW